MAEYDSVFQIITMLGMLLVGGLIVSGAFFFLFVLPYNLWKYETADELDKALRAKAVVGQDCPCCGHPVTESNVKPVKSTRPYSGGAGRFPRLRHISHHHGWGWGWTFRKH